MTYSWTYRAYITYMYTCVLDICVVITDRREVYIYVGK
nr:MAG TPA: hypothetical protein [Caudoviricetes sp.]